MPLSWRGARERTQPGLTNRVAISIGAIALITAMVVSGATFLFSRTYLITQRENAALNRALIDASVVQVGLNEGLAPGDALARVPSVGDSVPMINFERTWYTLGVTVTPGELPANLLSASRENGGALQRFIGSSGAPYLAVAVPVTSGMFVEVFPFAELQNTINAISWLLLGSSIAAFLIGGGVGRYAGSLLLKPLRNMAHVSRRITEGDLSARVDLSDDRDLGPISTAFNEMADTVQDRLDRERRFSANVSHELRSPLTGILGTAEILEGRLDRIPPQEASLVSALASQVRRFSALVLDLLELSRIGGDQSVQTDIVDVHTMLEGILTDRGGDPGQVHGAGGIVRTDRRRLERILGNLIDNAYKHGRGLRRIELESFDDQVMVHIDDRGQGIAPEDRIPIFEPFNRGGKTDRSGVGLGLAIAQEQARLLGALIAVDESPDGGGRFTVVLQDVVRP